jgi:hypothetical protein
MQETYSRISSLAITSAVFGVIATFGLLAPEFAIFALPAIAIGFVALSAICKYDLCGRRIALLGIAYGVFFVLATPIWHVSRFGDEALSGYERLDFFSIAGKSADNLQPWLGCKVCLKGYAWRPSNSLELNQFVMSPDGDEDQPKSAVAVQLPPGEVWCWSHAALAVSGNLVKNPAHRYDANSPKYLLKLSAVRDSKTSYDIVGRATKSGFGRGSGDGC